MARALNSWELLVASVGVATKKPAAHGRYCSEFVRLAEVYCKNLALSPTRVRCFASPLDARCAVREPVESTSSRKLLYLVDHAGSQSGANLALVPPQWLPIMQIILPIQLDTTQRYAIQRRLTASIGWASEINGATSKEARLLPSVRTQVAQSFMSANLPAGLNRRTLGNLTRHLQKCLHSSR